METIITPEREARWIAEIRRAAESTAYHDTQETTILSLSVVLFQSLRDLKSPAADGLRYKVFKALRHRGESDLAFGLYPGRTLEDIEREYEPEQPRKPNLRQRIRRIFA